MSSNKVIKSLVQHADIIVVGKLSVQAIRGIGQKGFIEITDILYGTYDKDRIIFILRNPKINPIEGKERIWFLDKEDGNENRDLLFNGEVSSVNSSSVTLISDIIETLTMPCTQTSRADNGNRQIETICNVAIERRIRCR